MKAINFWGELQRLGVPEALRMLSTRSPAFPFGARVTRGGAGAGRGRASSVFYVVRNKFPNLIFWYQGKRGSKKKFNSACTLAEISGLNFISKETCQTPFPRENRVLWLRFRVAETNPSSNSLVVSRTIAKFNQKFHKSVSNGDVLPRCPAPQRISETGGRRAFPRPDRFTYSLATFLRQLRHSQLYLNEVWRAEEKIFVPGAKRFNLPSWIGTIQFVTFHIKYGVTFRYFVIFAHPSANSSFPPELDRLTKPGIFPNNLSLESQTFWDTYGLD